MASTTRMTVKNEAKKRHCITQCMLFSVRSIQFTIMTNYMAVMILCCTIFCTLKSSTSHASRGEQCRHGRPSAKTNIVIRIHCHCNSRHNFDNIPQWQDDRPIKNQQQVIVEPILQSYSNHPADWICLQSCTRMRASSRLKKSPACHIDC